MRLHFKTPTLLKNGSRAAFGILVLLVAAIVPYVNVAPASAVTSLTRLSVSGDNTRYFVDQAGKIVYLTGSHNWSNLVDNGNGNPPPAFDYDEYLDFLESHDMNFVRLWAQEQARWTGETDDDDYWNGQNPYERVSGHGTANDGLNKFDLTSLDQGYFDRLRDRIEDAGDRDMYASVMLFNGWSTECKGGGGSCGVNNNPWDGHPYNAANNINSIDGDLDTDGFGTETHEYDTGDPDSMALSALQDEYVKKVVETVGDLPNVLYEICNECEGSTLDRDWQYHVIDLIHSYENTEFSVNHPVGYTMNFPNPNTSWLDNSNAEWVSQGGSMSNPTANNGTKVMIQDTDHLCGVCIDNEWPWKALVRGQQTLFMDRYDGASYGNDAGFTTNTLALSTWNNMRDNMGESRLWAGQIDLKEAVPSNASASTGFALVNDGTAADDQYLIYGPDGSSSFTVDLSNTTGTVVPKWYNIDTQVTTTASAVSAGGSSTSFTKPGSSTAGYALLLLQSDVTNPTVSVTAPAASATVSGSSVTLTATASDNRGVAGVQFKVDGTNVGSEDTVAPYSISWNSTTVGSGSHSITAVARDAASNTATSSGVSVTVNNGDSTNPTVSLTAPAASATVSGTTVTVSATASDNVAVAGVQFKVDGANIGSEDTSSPYSISWNSTTVTEGSHNLTAVARDTSSNTATSSAVAVTVDNYTGLVAAYGFNNNTSGTTRMADGSGNAYDLVCGTNCPTYSSAGDRNGSGAYDFSGSANWLETLTESPFDFTTNMTLEYWFKASTWGSTWAAMVTKGDSAWQGARYTSYDTIAFSTYNGSTYHDARPTTYATDDLNDNAWHHVALTYDGTNKKLYVDGSLVNTYGYTQTLNNNNYKVSLGYNLEYTPGEFAGMLDDVRIYNRALNGTEITTDMTTPVVN